MIPPIKNDDVENDQAILAHLKSVVRAQIQTMNPEVAEVDLFYELHPEQCDDAIDAFFASERQRRGRLLSSIFSYSV